MVFLFFFLNLLLADDDNIFTEVDDNQNVRGLQPSIKYQLCKELSPSKNKVIALNKNLHSNWITKFALFFDLALCDNNFGAFESQFGSHVLTSFNAFDKTKPGTSILPYLYDYDQLTYRCTVEMQSFGTCNGILSGIKIRLSNNGFLCSAADQNDRNQSNTVSNPNSPGW